MFEPKKATRVGVIPLIGAFGESGTGKTMSGLLLARGIAGQDGKIVMVDSETRRGSLYADVIPGGYEVIDLEEPFSPKRYTEALASAFASRAAVVVIDSMSHEHEGPGGVLDMASENEQKSGKAGLHNWRVPKFEHAKMVQFLLRAPVPVICCIRAKYKTRQGKDERGKTVIIKDDHTSPIQAEDFVYELTAHFEVLPNHGIRLTKVNHPALQKCFPTEGPIKIEHGEAIARWCKAPSLPTKLAASKDRKSELLVALRELTVEIHGWTKDLGATGWTIAKPKLQAWLADECAIDTLLDTQTVEELEKTLATAKAKLA